jgi:peroxiredoxin
MSKDSISVYFFLLDECRICQEMTPEINRLYHEFGSSMGFRGIFPNFSSKEEAINQFKQKYKIKFQTQMDYSKEISSKFNATVLPEVVVFNENTQTVLYRGAINDLFYKPGKRRQHIKHHYLKEALIAIRGGKLPELTQSTPIGCFINFNDVINAN